MEVGSSGEWREKNRRRRKRRLAGWACIRLSRATVHDATVAPKHVARLSLSTSGPLARVCQRGSSVAPKHVA